MVEKIKIFFVKQEWLVISIFLFVFVLVRIPGTDLPLHQDEYKWPGVVNPANPNGLIPHPPVGEFIYRTAGFMVGFDVHFRLVPLFFGAVNLLLLYYLMRFLFGRKEATIASLIWIFSYFSVLASLMVDTDGQIMPFFFLLALIGYFKLRDKNYNIKGNDWKWLVLLITSLVLGILVKLSFALAIGAIIADFLWSKKDLITRRDLMKYGGYSLLVLSGFVILIIILKFFVPFFELEKSLVYWEHFIVFFGRGWFQTGIQCVKAVLYLSPFLFLTPLFGFSRDFKESFSRIRVFLFFLIFAFIFYIILFDFSIGALDRYLQLLILPFSVMTTVVITKIVQTKNSRSKQFFFLGVVIGLGIFLLQLLPHYVPSLHPKSEWIDRIMSLRWNFLYPFSGGSGPLGFYVSFLFMALSWAVSFFALVIAWYKPETRKLVLMFLIPIGIIYNGVFIEEYLFGQINGSASRLLPPVVEFIKNNPDIKYITVYNDNGGAEIQAIGKYHKRLYVAPELDVNNEALTILNKYKEHYLEINVPRIDPTSFYRRFLDSCKVIYNQTDRSISAIVYDCTKAPDVK